MKKIFTLTSVILLLFILFSCKENNRKIRIGILPVIDTLPLIVADSEGIFKNEGINVELVFFNSETERDAAFMSGALDGASTDPVNFFLMVKNNIDVKLVCETFRTSTSSVSFGLMASPNYGIKTVKDIRNDQIAISSGTTTEFFLDRIMAMQGIRPETINKLHVKVLPVRYQMLMTGTIRLGLFPEPFVSRGLKNGAVLIADDRNLEATAAGIIFKNAFLGENKSFMGKFIASYNKSVKAINSTPEKYKEIMVVKLLLPADIKDSFKIPAFNDAVLPAEKDIMSVYYWMKQNGLISIPVEYKKLIHPIEK